MQEKNKSAFSYSYKGGKVMIQMTSKGNSKSVFLNAYH